MTENIGKPNKKQFFTGIINNKMKKSFLIYFLSVLILGCDTSEKDFEKALGLYSIESFESFLQEHPESTLADSAKMYIAYLTADSLGTADKYDSFIKNYPSSFLIKRASHALDSLTTINGGCISEMLPLSDEINHELDKITTDGSLNDLYKLLRIDRHNIKEKARPKIQEILKNAITRKNVNSRIIDSIQVIYLPDTNSSKFSYELSLLNKLNWLKIIETKKNAAFDHYYDSQTNLISNAINVFSEIKKDHKATSDETFASLFSTKYDRASNKAIDANTKKMNKIIADYNQTLINNVLLTIRALSNYPSDVCAKEQYWGHLSAHLDKNEDNEIILKFESSFLYPGSMPLTNKEEIIALLEEVHKNEKHEIIKKMASELIKKLK